MKRISLVAVTAALLLGAPVSAVAGAACDVLYDPVGDVGMLWNSDTIGQSNAVDITGLRMSHDDDTLTIAMSVRNLSAPPPPGVVGASYEVSWLTGETVTRARAWRTGSTWFAVAYAGRAEPAPVEHRRSYASSEVSIDVPLALVGLEPGDELTSVDARASEETGASLLSWSSTYDYAPNFSGGPERFTIGGACALSTDGAGQLCTAVRAVGDPEAPSGGARLSAIRFAVAPATLIAEIAVRDVDPGAADQEWQVSWRNPRLADDRGAQSAWARRYGESVEFGYTGIDSGGTTIGSVRDGVARIVIPRAGLRLSHGLRMTDVQGSYHESNGTFGTSDQLPEYGTEASWVVGATCDQAEIQACPIVTDRAGDARELEATEEHPQNFDGLDLREVGAVVEPDGALAVQARVVDLGAPDPPAADIAGWTISWVAGKDRVYAQAERATDGNVVYRYGVVEPDGEAPTGPVFAGRATTGRLDVARGIVSVNVPRAMMPSDGTVVSGMGATAWALSGRNTAAVYLVWDETGARTYQVGVACGL